MSDSSLSRTPYSYQYSSRLRADLSGGTLDIWPLYLMVPNSRTVQLSLNLYSHTTLTPHLHSDEIIIHANQNKYVFQNLSHLSQSNHPEVSLVKIVAQYMKPNCGFCVKLSSDSPIGGGLGSSSSLMVGLVECFSTWLHQKRSFLKNMYLCRDLEAQLLKTLTGIQDYIIPLQTPDLKHPWINHIHLDPIHPKIETTFLSHEFFDHIVWIDSQISHQSGQSNWNMIQSAFHSSKQQSLFQKIAEISLLMSEAIHQNKFKKIPHLFQKEYQVREQMSDYIHPKIKDIMTFVFRNKAQAVKVMGAGGGGVLLVWTSHKQELIKSCLKNKIRILEKL